MEDESERRLHRRWHNAVLRGLRSRPAESDFVVWFDADRRITLVRHNTSPRIQRERAEEVAILANGERDFDTAEYHANEEPDERDVHVFLYHARNRVIGLLVIDKRRDDIWKATWEQYDDRNAPELPRLTDLPYIWSIGMVWVHRTHRRKGFARHMVKVATEHLGCADCFGWYTPFTDSGKALARSLCPTEFYIGK